MINSGMLIEQGDVMKSNCRGGCAALLDVALGEGFFEEMGEQIPAAWSKRRI